VRSATTQPIRSSQRIEHSAATVSRRAQNNRSVNAVSSSSS